MVSPREAIIRNGLPPALVDDPLFRKALVTTSRMGQTAVCMGKGTALGKRHYFATSSNIHPTNYSGDRQEMDEENMARMKSKMQKVGGTIMSDGCQYTTSLSIMRVSRRISGQ
jgi:hypothetical protein